MSNPYIRFMVSEFWASLAGLTVYLLFYIAAFLAAKMAAVLPLQNPEPAEFLANALSWGGAVSGVATFVVISAYQIFILTSELWRRGTQGMADDSSNTQK